MPSIQIKDVPNEVHTVLRRRAAAAGKSLQEFLLAQLVKDASHPTVDEVLDRAGESSGGNFTLADADRIVRQDRDSR